MGLKRNLSLLEPDGLFDMTSWPEAATLDSDLFLALQQTNDDSVEKEEEVWGGVGVGVEW